MARSGVATYNHDSSRLKGRRRISGGRAALRTALYVATLTSTRFNPAIREFYQRLLAAGKVKESDLGRVHVQAVDDLECRREIRHAVERKNERNEGRKCLTFDTVACSLDVSGLSSPRTCHLAFDTQGHPLSRNLLIHRHDPGCLRLNLLDFGRYRVCL